MMKFLSLDLKSVAATFDHIQYPILMLSFFETERVQNHTVSQNADIN